MVLFTDPKQWIKTVGQLFSYFASSRWGNLYIFPGSNFTGKKNKHLIQLWYLVSFNEVLKFYFSCVMKSVIVGINLRNIQSLTRLLMMMNIFGQTWFRHSKNSRVEIDKLSSRNFEKFLSTLSIEWNLQLSNKFQVFKKITLISCNLELNWTLKTFRTFDLWKGSSFISLFTCVAYVNTVFKRVTTDCLRL